MYAMAGGLVPPKQPKLGCFSEDHKKLEQDFFKVNSDLNVAIKKVKNEQTKRR